MIVRTDGSADRYKPGQTFIHVLKRRGRMSGPALRPDIDDSGIKQIIAKTCCPIIYIREYPPNNKTSAMSVPCFIKPGIKKLILLKLYR